MIYDCVIVDIDGTVANVDHRLHHISGLEKNWKSFNAACPMDSVYPEIVHLVRELHSSGLQIVVVTGRDEAFKEKTISWLASNNIPCNELYMRPKDNKESDYIVKRKIFREHITTRLNVIFALEDRSRVVQMWRNEGLTCLQVKEGDY